MKTKLVIGLVLVMVTALASVVATATLGAALAADNKEVVKFDVAEDFTRLAVDETPVHDDGHPAYGAEFVTQGYIYPHGTLNGSNGVLPDGSPEFPDLVIGEWSCWGFHIGDGANTKTGPWVVTTQLYDLGEEPGAITLVSEGYELADVNVEFLRAITGGTGRYRHARGEATQEFLGFNQSNGINLRFEIDLN